MAFASVGTLGLALSSGNNQSTLVLTTSAAAEVGNLVVVAIAVDNRTGTGGASTDVSGVSDNSTSGPNNWQRAVGFTNTNGGAAQDGADISIWYAKITTQIDNGGTITATFTSATTSDATAMSAWEFTVSGGVAVENTNTLANDAAAAGSLDATTANIECLRFRATASESNSSTVWTKTAAFDSLITQAVSGAGTSATEMGVRGEFDISTGTGSASAPTGGAGAVDNASAYVAFKETTAHVGEARFAGAGSFSAQAVKKPSEATFAGNGAIYNAPSSLLHFEGPDGAQIFTDERGHIWTANGGANTDNAQQKFGLTSANFDGTSDFITGDASDDFVFGTGDFTIDFWLRLNALGAFKHLIDFRPSGTNGGYPDIYLTSTNELAVFVNSTNILVGSTVLTTGQWYHVAWTRSGTTSRLFIDGVVDGGSASASDSTNYLVGASRPMIGASGTLDGGESLNGWIDEVRLWKGVAAWASTFTPSSSPYFVQGLAATLNMAAQERLGGAGSFSAEATITSAGGTAHVGEARFSGASNLSANVTAQLQAAAILSPDARDDFNRADGALGSNWTTATGLSVLEIASNVIRPTSVSAHCVAYWNANQFSDDQFSQCTIIQIGAGSAFLGPTVRHQAGASNSFYVIYAGSDSTLNFFKWTTGSATQVGAAGPTTAFSPGDVLRLEASGSSTTTLVVKVNGVQIHSVTDSVSPFVSGSPGINVFAGAAVVDARIDDWSAGQLSNSNLSIDAAITSGVVQQAEATFAGTGSFSANLVARFAVASTFMGSGSVSINAFLAQQVQATFAGTGAFSINATSAGTQTAEARFGGAGNFSINVIVRHAAAATFAGTGAISVPVRQTMAAQATLQGAGSFSPLVSQAWAVGAIFAGVGNFSFHGIQLKPLIPDGDSSTGGWLTEVDSLPLFPSIDEIVPLDADYIKSSPAPTVDICKISLSNPTTSALTAPVSVLYRYGKSGTDTAQLQVRLLQGTTMIAVWQHDDIAAGFVTVEQFLTDGMISNITDWNDLFLEFKSGTITTHMARATFNGLGVM